MVMDFRRQSSSFVEKPSAARNHNISDHLGSLQSKGNKKGDERYGQGGALSPSVAALVAENPMDPLGISAAAGCATSPQRTRGT